MAGTIDNHATASARSSELWSRAFQALSEKDRRAVNFDTQTVHKSIVEDILATAKAKQKDKLDSSLKIKLGDRTIVIRKVFDNIVDSITKFQDAADFLVSLDASGHAALPWAGVKFFISIAVKDSKNFAAVLAGMEFVTREISYYGILEVFYLRRGFTATDQLSDALVNVYANVLKYLSKAKQYYEQHTLPRAMLTAFSSKSDLDGIISAITSGRGDIASLTRLVDAEITQNMREKLESLNEDERKRHGRLRALLVGFGAPIEVMTGQLRDVKETVDKISLAMIDKKSEEKIKAQNECKGKLLLTDPVDDLAAIRRAKGTLVDGTCKWLLVRKEYTDWLDGDNPGLLQLIGRPGIGKTMISSFLVHELERKAEQRSGMTLVYYFCDNKDQKRSTATAILRGLLLQLLRQRPILIKHIMPEFELKKESLFDNLDALWKILLDMLKDQDAGEVYVLVDALDECEISSWKDFLDLLEPLVCSEQPDQNINVKFLITCRPEVRELDRGRTLPLDVAEINTDLLKFIDVKVNKLSKSKEYPPDLTEYIKTALTEGAGGTFLWVSLILDDIRDTKPSKIRKKLSDLPRSLSDVYSRILHKIEDVEEARFILQWVVGAHRPLTVQELATACALRQEWDGNTIPPASTVAEYNNDYKDCEPIIYRDADNNTIHLLHQSAKDYLLDKYLEINLDGPSQYHLVPSKMNLLIFEICWKYFSMEEFEHGTAIIGRGPDNQLIPKDVYELEAEGIFEDNCFLLYAAQEWRKHALAAAPALVTGYEWDSDKLGEMPTMRDAWLLSAAEGGKEDIVQLLLEHKADLGAKDEQNRTALHLAAEAGHEQVVSLLLEKGADPNLKATDGSTPLWRAAKFGKYEVVKQLLPLDGLDINAKSKNFMAPLAEAAREGHEKVVTLLVEKGADLNIKDDEDSTPLLWAACRGKIAVVKEFLSLEGVELDAQDYMGITALGWAVGRGYEEISMLLLDHGADPNIKDHQGRSIVHHAAHSSLQATLRMVLAWKNIQIHGQNEDGYTALHIAAQRGRVGCVEDLVDAGIDPDILSYAGKTSLDYALEVGTPDAGHVIAFLVSREARVGLLWDLSSEIVQEWAGEEWFPALEKALKDTSLVDLPDRRVDPSWTRTTSCRDDMLEIDEYSSDIPCLELTVQSNLPSPVRRIVFRTVSHDQGWCTFCQELIGSYQDSDTCFEADIRLQQNSNPKISDQKDHNPCPKRRLIQKNARACGEYRLHTNVWDYRNSQPEMREWMNLLGPGDVLQVFAKAAGQGWANYVKSVEVEIYCETAGL